MREIALCGGQVATVDDDDYELVSKSMWSVTAGGYAQATIKQKVVTMHRLIMGFPGGKVVHHRDGNRLHNHKSNLMVSTVSEHVRRRKANRTGSSKYKGVYWSRARGKWIAQVSWYYYNQYLGGFDNEDDAACAYAAATGQKTKHRLDNMKVR